MHVCITINSYCTICTVYSGPLAMLWGLVQRSQVGAFWKLLCGCVLALDTVCLGWNVCQPYIFLMYS